MREREKQETSMCAAETSGKKSRKKTKKGQGSWSSGNKSLRPGILEGMTSRSFSIQKEKAP